MTLEDIQPFFDYVKSKKVVTDNTAHNWSGALNAIEATLEPQEKTFDFVLGNAAVIRNRLQKGNVKISGNTIDVYLRRAATAIDHCIEWKSDRAKWEKDMAMKASAPRREKGDTQREPKGVIQMSDFEKFPANGQSVVIPVPIGNGKSFRVGCPDEYVMSDVIRVAWALAVQAIDFDPSQFIEVFKRPPAPRQRAEIVELPKHITSN